MKILWSLYGKKTMNNTRICWIIRFTDGTLASYYGAKDGAIAKAEELKDLYGGDYIIT